LFEYIKSQNKKHKHGPDYVGLILILTFLCTKKTTYSCIVKHNPESNIKLTEHKKVEHANVPTFPIQTFNSTSFLLQENGKWGRWSPFNDCTLSCGGGTQTRSRLCNDPAPSNGGEACPGISEETILCNTQDCPSLFPNFKLIFQF
jgi:hypothetical protein